MFALIRYVTVTFSNGRSIHSNGDIVSWTITEFAQKVINSKGRNRV